MTEARAIMVMGVSACGKSTLASRLASELGASFLEGDDYHPQANVEKMSAGTPLTEADRVPWIEALTGAINQALESSQSVVFSCSALSRSIRQMLDRTISHELTTLFLDISPEEARDRVAKRSGHFMPAALVDSQFAALQSPLGEARTFAIDAGLPLDRLVDQAKKLLITSRTT